MINHLNKFKKSALVIYARKNSVKILSRYSKTEVITAIIEAKKNGSFADRGF